MSLVGSIFVVVAVWCTIYAAHHLLRRRFNHLLPIHGVKIQNSITLNGVHLRISTTRWNAYHHKAISFFARRRKQRITSLLLAMYNFGVLCGVVGMIFVVSLSLTGLLREISTLGHGKTVIHHHKRAFEETDTSSQNAFPLVRPVIPGLTVPLHHLPIILLSVLFAQLIHELGHAAAAAVDALPMTAAGFSFTVCVPAAFVKFSSSATYSLKRDARTRIIAAGPFHNLVFWCLLALLLRLKIGHFSSLISGYKDVSTIGKVVVDVKYDSPLFLHLEPGSIITQLDDTLLSSSTTEKDKWTEYLTNTELPTSLGWCVDGNIIANATSECCDGSSISKTSSPTCFVTFDGLYQHCVDPVGVFGNPSYDRCSDTAQCAQESRCVSPHRNSRLLRLKVRPQGLAGHETLVVWSGPAIEIFEDVQVSIWLPRAFFLPLKVPILITYFWEYLTMATLSLYLFNLLPLPYLDGTELLKEFIGMVLKDEAQTFAYDVELGEHVHGRTRGERWRQRIMTLVHLVVAACLTMYALLAIINFRH